MAAATSGTLLLAGPAVADTPAAWEEPGELSLLTALLVFAGIPLALMAVITFLVSAGGLVRGDRQQRGVASWTQPEWFGGPQAPENPRGSRSAGVELEGSADAAAATRSRAESEELREPGGASARW